MTVQKQNVGNKQTNNIKSYSEEMIYKRYVYECPITESHKSVIK